MTETWDIKYLKENPKVKAILITRDTTVFVGGSWSYKMAVKILKDAGEEMGIGNKGD